MDQVQETKLLQPGHNCWRVTESASAKILIDADAFFTEFSRVAARAEQTITIIGWDIDSRSRLFVTRPHDLDDSLPNQLGHFLKTLLKKKPKLQVRILTWDYAILYALEREWIPLLRFGWRRRLRYVRDNNHPIGASHHQKIVIIDNKIAFSGGIDLCQRRWDTPAHSEHNRQRIDNYGFRYLPFHDVQVMLTGVPVQHLAELAMERWRRRTGEDIQLARWALPGIDLAQPDFVKCKVALARTDPAHQGRPAIQEVQNLFFDMISAAHKLIYLENQYLTHLPLAKKIAERLTSLNGPEVIIICPKNCSGWLEKNTMGFLRRKFINIVTNADKHNRLKVLHPAVGKTYVNVHSKVLIIDDRYLRIGSANISNRSMGLDTECDVIIDAGNHSEQRTAIRRIWQTLLAEHAGVSMESVKSKYAATNSVIALLPTLKSRIKTLEEAVDDSEIIVDDPRFLIADVADPSLPMGFEDMVEDLMPEGKKSNAKSYSIPYLKVIISMLVVAGLAYLWNTPEFRQVLAVDNLAAYLQGFKHSYTGFFAAVGLFVVGSLIMVPVTAMIVVTAVVFGGMTGVFYSLCGSLSAAGVSYWLGSTLRDDFVKRIARGDWYKKRLQKKGIIAIATLRMIPIAPFSVVNLAAGAAHIDFAHFIIGTCIGMLPGILAINAINLQVLRLLEGFNLPAFLLLAATLLCVATIIRWLSLHLRQDA